MTARLSAVPALLLLLTGGCIMRQTADADAARAFVVGKTSKAQVLEHWGNPDGIRGDEWVWKDWKSLGSKFKLGYWGIGFTMANARMTTVEHCLVFDEKGVLTSMRELRATADDPEWQPFPW